MDTNIGALRKAKHITLSELARQAEINKGRLSLIERGIHHPDNLEVKALSEVLGSPVKLWIPVRPRRAK